MLWNRLRIVPASSLETQLLRFGALMAKNGSMLVQCCFAGWVDVLELSRREQLREQMEGYKEQVLAQ